MEYGSEYVLGVLTTWDDGEFFPSAIRADEDYMARYDINIWLNTGRTEHFIPPPPIIMHP